MHPRVPAVVTNVLRKCSTLVSLIPNLTALERARRIHLELENFRGRTWQANLYVLKCKVADLLLKYFYLPAAYHTVRFASFLLLGFRKAIGSP
jgi:hypothetical protein